MVLKGMCNRQQNRFHSLINRVLFLESNLISSGAIAKAYAAVIERVKSGTIPELSCVRAWRELRGSMFEGEVEGIQPRDGNKAIQTWRRDGRGRVLSGSVHKIHVIKSKIVLHLLCLFEVSILYLFIGACR
jgi:hypothetical protein